MNDGASRTITLIVSTPEGQAIEEQVRGLRFPGSDGFIGVRPRHAPMLATVSCGILHVDRSDGVREQFAIGEGFAEVDPATATLLVDFLNRRDDVDMDRAHSALTRADERQGSRDRNVDTARAEAALCRAITRLKVCGCGCSLCDKSD